MNNKLAEVLENPDEHEHLLRILQGQIVILSDRRNHPAWKDIEQYHKTFRKLSISLPFFNHDGEDPLKDIVRSRTHTVFKFLFFHSSRI